MPRISSARLLRLALLFVALLIAPVAFAADNSAESHKEAREILK